MLLSDLRNIELVRKAFLALVLVCFGGLSACQFKPLYGSDQISSGTGGGLSTVSVSQVNSRVGQQVRNHLLFLLHGGNASVEKTHEARIRVTWNNRLLSQITGIQDSSAGTVTVTVSYDLIDLASGKAIASGTRQADASYDRTGQVFANKRAERDPENRAAVEAAEAVRLAIAGHLGK